MSSTPSKSRDSHRISHYFSPKSRVSLGLKRPHDLTADDDDDNQHPPSPKKPKPSSTPEQWRYDPGASSTPRNATEDKKRRHEAFKKKLLQSNNPFLKRYPSATSEAAQKTTNLDDDVNAEDVTNSPPGSDSGSDSAFKELTSMFASKGRKPNKGKSKAPAATASSVKKKADEVGPSGQSYTPLEKQVLQLKQEYHDTVLMVEVGYKYKFFGDDAKVAARDLGMACYLDRNFLVASIPSHRRNVHLKKLLSQGHRVGVVTQVETAALKKISENRNAPFDRKMTCLYTAATYVDDLDSVDDTEKYSPPPFVCVIEQPKSSTNKGDVNIGWVSICPSTGDVVWDDFQDTSIRLELETRLAHTRPAELLLEENGLTKATEMILAQSRSRIERFSNAMTYSDAFSFVSSFYADKRKLAAASENVKSGQLIASMSDFPKRVVIALAHAMKHLSAYSIADALLETRFFTKFATKTHMLLAANTLSNLEIYRNETDYTSHGSLMWILDKTATRFGARLLKHWVGRPLTDRRALDERVNAVEEVIKSTSDKLVTLRQLLKKLPDLSKGLCRIQYGQCTPEELAVLLSAFKKIAEAFNEFSTPSDVGLKSRILNEIVFCLPAIKKPMTQILSAVSLQRAADGDKIRLWNDPDKYPGLDDADIVLQTVEIELNEELKKIRKDLRMPSLQWSTVAGEEYLVELKRSDNRPIPDTWHLVSRTKTLARYRPPVVKVKLDERSQRQEILQAEADLAFRSFLEEISQKHYGVLREAVSKLAIADCLLSLAVVGMSNDYVRPVFTDDDTFEIVNGRHPMVETLRTDPFVPNTIKMGGGTPRNKIITGPNMGGKSSAVRMVALITVMAQIGSFVPASSVKLQMVDSILTRMGASDDLARGRSTFMVEMSETSEILHSVTPNSLVILDELGRGTSTFDGMAIADAVMHHLIVSARCRTLFITHYPLVATDLEEKFPRDVENLHMRYEEQSRLDGSRGIIFLYQMSAGLASESFGIECARLAGLPESILFVASQRSSHMQEEVERRTKINLVRKVMKILNQKSNAVMAVGLDAIANTLGTL